MIRKSFFFVLVFLIILLLIFLNFKNFLSNIKNFFLKILEGFISFFKNIAKIFANAVQLIFQIKFIQQENEKLKNDNLILISKLINAEKLIENYKALEKQFNLKNQDKYKYVFANVVGISSQEFGEYLILNKGKSSGIEINMPVVVNNVLVGKIFEVYQDYSKVVLVNDGSIKIAAKIQNKNAIGVTQNRDGQIYINFVVKNEQIEKDDIVLTSGRDGVFMANLILGQIEEIYESDNQLFKKVKIKPLINYYQLENVFIITNYLK